MAEEFISLETYEKVPYGDSQVVEIRGKIIQGFNDQISLKGESYSQYIVFEVERYYDGIDLTSPDLLIQIAYQRPDGVGDVCPAVDVSFSDSYIRFAWLVPYSALTEIGILRVMPFVYGRVDGKAYILKTIFAEYEVHDALQISDIVEEPTDNWYLQFLNQIIKIGDFSDAIDATIVAKNEAVQASADAVAAKDDAVTAKNTAEASAQSAAEDAEKAQLYGSSLKIRLESNEAKIEAQESRIDAFTHLAEGTTTGDAELIDIRTGYDGTTYTAAGTAVREQIADAHDSFQQELEAATAATQIKLDEKVDGAFTENGYLYLTSNNVVVVGPLGPFSGGGGGGGGGGGNDAVLTLSNSSGWLSKTITEGADCVISATWYSTLDDEPTGNGTMTVTVNGSSRLIMNVTQGNVSFNAGSYVAMGSNIIKVTVSDVYGNTRTINYTVNVVSLTIRSSFDANTPKEGLFTFPYIPTGNVEKTVYFIVDGNVIGTATTTASGRQQSYNIPAQSHGGHTLRVYFEAVVNNEIVRSNELFYGITCIESGNNTPVIASDFDKATAEQYTTLNISYSVYDPATLTPSVSLYANGNLVSSQTIDRSVQTWAYRADDVGTLTLKIQTGKVSKTFTVNITESSVTAKAVDEDLALNLQSVGRSNNEANPGIWSYNNISCNFSGFNYSSDGWVLDDDGITVLRVSGDARLDINYMPFEQDFRNTGKTIEIEFATRDVLNYDTPIITCMSDNRGFEITAQGAELHSEQSTISTQYKENEHVRLTFVVEKWSENRLIYCYLNGTMCGATRYSETDDFSQLNPVIINIGTNLCTVDLYSIRIYDNDLTRQQVLDNWIADTQNITLMLQRYRHNSVYDEYGNIVIAQLPNDLPYMIVTTPELSQSKEDEKIISVTYVDPKNSANSFTATGVSMKVQGTSSAVYPRKNYKLKFANGFLLENGESITKYKLRPNSIPVKTFTFKADFASSEGANNVELVRLYDDICPYDTPAQKQDDRVRQGIDGFPIVMFWNNGSETKFLGKENCSSKTFSNTRRKPRGG